MKLGEAKLCPRCKARAGSHFGIAVNPVVPGSVNIAVLGSGGHAWPEKVRTETYHVRMRGGPLLCRAPADWAPHWKQRDGGFSPDGQRLVELAQSAINDWGDDLSKVDEETPHVELEDAASRARELAGEAVLAAASGEYDRAVAQAANAAQLELLYLGQRLGYNALWTELKRGQ